MNLLQDFTDPMTSVPLGVAVLRLVTAMLLGGIIGWEREVNARAAGLRTHMLIALAACVFALLAPDLTGFMTDTLPGEGVEIRIDPLRLIEAVTAGVAFLAAGSIITGRGTVHGLTTGAGMWMAGAIGLACGIGRPAVAGMATLLALGILSLIRLVERRDG